jgi:hypothetical protein
VAVQEVSWVEGGSQPADDYTYFCGKGNANHCLGTGIFVHQEIRSPTRVEFIGGRMLYTITKRLF